MSTDAEMIPALQAQLALCQRVLRLLEQEHETLSGDSDSSTFQFYQQRKQILPELNASLAMLKQLRLQWQALPIRQRHNQPEFPSLLRANQDSIMKALLLDRQNEQVLLRRGLVPANHLPAVNRQRPHFVADLYRRNHSP